MTTTLQTKVFDAQDALTAALQAYTGSTLAGWSVDFGLPARRAEKHIWVDEQVSEWQQSGQTTGLLSKSETFRMHVYIYVRLTGATALAVRDECKAAGAVVEQIIGGCPLLGGAAMMAQTVGGEYDGAFADPEARAREGALHLIIETQTFLG